MRGVGLLVLVLAFAAGCSTGGPAGPAGPPGPGDPATSTSTATTPPPLSSTDLPTIGPSGPPKHPSDNLKPIVASGTVRVSPGCVDLVTDGNVIWTLFGAVAKGLQDGDRVRVTGQPAVQLESACRGSPLAVLTATRM